jgi:hypothetical protein
MHKRWRGFGEIGSLLALIIMTVTGSGCEGQGTGGDGLIIRVKSPSLCVAIGNPFPSGLVLLSESTTLAAVAHFSPPALAVYEYSSELERPVQIAITNIGVDSDGDGVDDQLASAPLFPCRIFCETRTGGVLPVVGALNLIDDGLAFLSTSNYEQVLSFDPTSAAAMDLLVDVPASIPVDRYPMLPSPGSTGTRRGVSTFVCVEPPDPFDSDDLPIEPDDRCNPDQPSYLTSFTAGSTIAAGRLFVAMSNFVVADGAYRPGTVLVYDWMNSVGQITVRPLEDDAVLFTSGFNPTGLARHITPGGRELVLVTVTGAMLGVSVTDSARTEAAIDVIDPSGPRIVATIPLGLAAPALEPVEIDASGQIGWIGSVTSRQLYAVDLRALDDPNLYLGSGPPVILDGLTLGFPDSRIFSADAPLVLPDRLDRSSSPSCDGLTSVATNVQGTEAFATDYCDGTLTRIRFDLTGDSAIPYSADRFQIIGQTTPFAPTPSPGEQSGPGFIEVRPGVPAVDYESPDVFVLVADPGLLCGIRIEAL